MWRNSLNSFSSKLLAFSSTKNPSFSNKPPSLLLLRIYSPRVNYGFFERSNSTSAGSTAGDTVKLGGIQIQDDRVRAFGSSAAAVDPSSLAAFSCAKEVVDLAKHYGQCYWELSKAKLSMLVVATSGAGYVLGSGNAVDIAGLCCTCAGTMMVAAAANSLNQVFEIRNDALMKRTMRRPLPSGRLSKPHAVIWASSVGLAGTALLACQANMLAAGLAASNLVLYAFVYTPLKQIHPINTWVGAVVGAIPPLLGGENVLLLMDSSLEGQYADEDATALVELASKCLQYEARDRPDIKFLLTAVEPLQKQKEVSSLVLMGQPKTPPAVVLPTMLSPLGKACARMDLTAVHEILLKTGYRDEEGAENELSFQEWTQQVQDMLNTKKFGDVAFRDKDYKGAIDSYSKLVSMMSVPSGTIFVRRALSYLMLGQPELALRDAMQAQVCLPEWPTAFYMQALALSKLGMETDAQDMLNDGASFEAKRQNSWRN